MKNLLTIYYHDNIASIINLNEYGKSLLSLGRAPDNDIILNSSIVSNHHAVISIDENDCVIQDNNSTNGLIVNNKTFLSVKLQNGDIIKIDSSVSHHEEAVTMMFSQVNEEEDQRWIQFHFKDKSIINIGRDSDNDIVLKHAMVSRHHAALHKNNFEFYLEDLKSTNSTYLNGCAVTSSIILKEEDEIIIGNTKLIFYEDRLTYYVITSGVSIEAIDVGKTIKESNGFLKKTKIKRLLDDISISIKPGELTAIIGRSGAGKSTFLDALNGSRKANEGIILVNNDDYDY